jgi:hypothetical protein
MAKGGALMPVSLVVALMVLAAAAGAGWVIGRRRPLLGCVAAAGVLLAAGMLCVVVLWFSLPM